MSITNNYKFVSLLLFFLFSCLTALASISKTNNNNSGDFSILQCTGGISHYNKTRKQMKAIKYVKKEVKLLFIYDMIVHVKNQKNVQINYSTN